MRLRHITTRVLLFQIILLAAVGANAQSRKMVRDKGLIHWQQQLLEMATDKRLMCIAAHPDDEDSETLAYYNRGYGVQTSIMLANWGEGGQNEIGSELYEELGVIRSKETLEAAGLLGTKVYCLNQVDFGFSKSIEETWEFWNKEEALERAVRILRIERPHVIVTNHRVGEGHGNHQAMAELIVEAIPLAASPERYTDQLAEGLVPWEVERLFQRRRHHEGVPIEEYDVQIPVGLMNLIRGFSYQEIAGEALMRHQSQGAKGIWQWINARRSQSPFNYFYLTVGDPPLGPFEDLFDGMDNCWWTREGRSPFSHEGLIRDDPTHEDKRRAGLEKALHLLRPDLEKVEEALVEAMNAIEALPAEVDDPANWLGSATGEIVNSSEAMARYQIEVIDRMQNLGKESKDIQRILSKIWGIDTQIDISEKNPFPGQEFEVEISLTNRGLEPVSVNKYRLEVPEGWESAGRSFEIGEIGSMGTARASFWVKVATDEQLTVPETEELYRSPTPWQPNIRGVAFLEKSGTPGFAEIEERIEIAPAWEIWLSPEETLFPLGSAEALELSVETRRHSEVRTPSPLTVKLPDGKTPQTTIRPTGARRTSTTVKWEIPADAKPGAYSVEAELESGSRTYRASATITLANVKVAEGLKVGVVRSYDDTLPKALDRLGVSHSLLEETDVRSGDLSQFDTILIDIRAYLERQDLVESNGRFLNYCARGGRLVVFYHKTFEWNEQDPPLAPIPLLLSRDRITDEKAPVQILDRDHSILTWPNEIGSADWEGWVQERGLYFPGEYDDRYDEIVAFTDPNEQPLRSGILAAEVGEGTYIYTSLVFYRQLKALVPGAYRLFANLISYGQEGE